MNSNNKGFGTAPVFFTAISTILGAILFLRFGFAVGTIGFWGVIGIILLGHLVTIPTALVLSAGSEDLVNNQLIMARIVLRGAIVISEDFNVCIAATSRMPSSK